MTLPALHRRTALLALASTAWVPTAPAAEAAPLKVVASFSILADWAREVGGDRVDVQTLVGPDEDAHAYSPTPTAARRLAQADVVLVNGLHFEGWIDRLVKASGFKGPVVVVTKGIPVQKIGGDVDPHVWQDISLARQAVAHIAQAFAGARAADASAFLQRAAAYDEALAATDARIRERLSAVPPDRRKVITSHDAFGYFGKAYGVTFLAPQGWTTEKEATAAQVGRLVRQLKAQQVRAVFVENMSNPRLVQRLATEGGATLGGTLYADALSRPDGPAATYLRLMQHNTDELVKALTR